MKPTKGTIRCSGCGATGAVHQAVLDGVPFVRAPHHWYSATVPVVQEGQGKLVLVLTCDRCISLGRTGLKRAEAPTPESAASAAETPAAVAPPAEPGLVVLTGR